MNGGKNVEKGSGHDMASRLAGTQPAEPGTAGNTAGGLSARHRPHNK